MTYAKHHKCAIFVFDFICMAWPFLTREEVLMKLGSSSILGSSSKSGKYPYAPATEIVIFLQTIECFNHNAISIRSGYSQREIISQYYIISKTTAILRPMQLCSIYVLAAFPQKRPVSVVTGYQKIFCPFAFPQSATTRNRG